MKLPAASLLTGVLVMTVSSASSQPVSDYPIRPVPFTCVRIDDGFWAPRLATNRTVTVPYDFAKCEETGRLTNFTRAGGLEDGQFEGIPFNDSDVFKVVEGAAYTLALGDDPELDAYLDRLIASFAAAQEEDGYLYTARRLCEPETIPGMSGKTRWSNLSASHELYNVGHMYEAAVAHYEATGKRSFLDIAARNADFLCDVFGPGEGKLKTPPGHQEIEIGLAKLYRATGTRAYLDLAKFFLDVRGRDDIRDRIWGAYCQDHAPVVEQDAAVGHAVRACYMYAGMADVAALTGDRDTLAALDLIWEDVAKGKLYLTGGVGARHAGEAFGDLYELPNETAYNETCAAIANALWNHRMFLLHGDAKYMDVFERTVYNGFLSGISLTGDRFFYPNPLAAHGGGSPDQGASRRAPWFGCSCCPVNIVRFVPSMPGYVYAVRDRDVYINLYTAGEGTVSAGDTAVTLRQATRYPWDGAVEVTVGLAESAEFGLRLRIPGWALNRPVPGELYRYADVPQGTVSLAVNGERIPVALEQGYAVLRRRWQPGDRVSLELPLAVRPVECHPYVEANRGRVAFERGPIVYCFEGIDNGGEVADLVFAGDAGWRAVHEPDLLGGVTVLRGTGSRAVADEDGAVSLEPQAVTAVPYYAWAHRDNGAMAVWMAASAEVATPRKPPTIASRATASASHCHSSDAEVALNDQREPADSCDHGIPRFTWWDHRGTQEWVQYDFAEPASVKAVSVYWFDDTGRGACRVPASWRLLYRDGEQWKPVAATGPCGVARDRFNDVAFAPVQTDALRIEVALQPDLSGGILEWTVTEAR